MKAIFYWKNTKTRKNSYIFLSTIILIFLFTGISLSLAMIHANQIASLENVNHYYEKRINSLVEEDKNP
ncbi:hypothetical protein [Oenococcus oeni]|uniref:Uncharacterized protein n=1 Tax=Oenococcus oeni TaxID=1247 RepID=A0A483CVF0_OENOE|nr:hypothetical protein [Oenococcus oeni]KGI01588.1 hypothetical protein X293_06015 [Oenococcus oeni IOEB_C52]OIL37827.1 hypothetical protein ATX11_06195 [Oenococcus oeni]OIM21021.1 hypothetical protein ATX59_06170 [Oenococcus oeni]OIM23040.1 hypothetical protein ATX60_06340 [Oenococcus oeni]OIM26129.1 hypothetical protein ATX61_06380 [Oenococcus oeni]